MIKAANKKSRGRPKRPDGVDPVSAVRLPAILTRAVDKWSEANNCSRSEAIRQLVELGLASAPHPQPRTKGRRRASDMAASTIDSMADASASAEDQAQRKRRPLKGSGEFRDMRSDGPSKSKG